jgi:hypothetical protein
VVSSYCLSGRGLVVGSYVPFWLGVVEGSYVPFSYGFGGMQLCALLVGGL